MSKIYTCEQVSNGHPDKICDQIADAVVTDCLQRDKDSRVAIECLLKNHRLIIAGELTSKHRPDYRRLAEEVFDRIGYEKLGYGMEHYLDISILVSEQSPDIALGVDKGGAGDQGIMFGYATNETPELLPIPFAVATEFLQLLKNHPSRMFRADAKAQVSYDYDSGRITTFLCSVQHSPDVEVGDFRHIIESMMVLAACKYGIKGDFEKLVNPTGRFVVGGSFADCGVTAGSWPVIPMAASGGSAAGLSLEKTPLRWTAPVRTWRGRLRRILSAPGMQTGVKSSWPTPLALWNLYLWRWTASALSTRTRNSSAPMSGRTTT